MLIIETPVNKCVCAHALIYLCLHLDIIPLFIQILPAFYIIPFSRMAEEAAVFASRLPDKVGGDKLYIMPNLE